MNIRKFWAKGYRSLRDVALEDIGDVAVFYGPNGSGKSNVIDAVQTFFGVMPIAVDTAYGTEARLSFREAGREALQWIREDDFYARSEEPAPIVLGAVIEDRTSGFGGVLFEGKPVQRAEVEVRFARHPTRADQFSLQITRLFVNFTPPGLPFQSSEIRDLLRGIVPQAFTHLAVTRTLAASASPEGEPKNRQTTGTIRDGELVRELFKAKNSRDRQVRERFDDLRKFMATTLGRGELDVFMDPDTQGLELREKLSEPNPLGRDIPVDHAGHGVIQVYAIVASILLGGGRLVALEEPEAHLHAPTLGRQLRTILEEMVQEGRIDQLFIATHSNLFDLDPAGYWDVSMTNGDTHVERKPLDEIDRLHLFEPGPAKHQLQELLRLYGDEVVFKTQDGRVISAKDMLVSLQRDDDVAKAFLQSVHSAALQVTGLRAKRSQPSGRGASD